MKKLLIMVFSILLSTSFIVQAENKNDFNKYIPKYSKDFDKKIEVKIHLRDYLEQIKSETGYTYVISNCNQDLLYINIKEIKEDKVIYDQLFNISNYLNIKLDNKVYFDIYTGNKVLNIKCN